MTTTVRAEAWLVDERWTKAYPLFEETMIGRGAASTILLRDPAVSRRHARVTRTREGYVLSSLGSAGTKVNGMRVGSDCVLQEGDVIEIAFTSLRFTLKAPTGEMFVIRRDLPTASDREEPTTRVTLHAMHPITLMTRWRRHWHFALGLLAIVVMLLVLLAKLRW